MMTEVKPFLVVLLCLASAEGRKRQLFPQRVCVVVRCGALQAKYRELLYKGGAEERSGEGLVARSVTLTVPA